MTFGVGLLRVRGKKLLYCTLEFPPSSWWFISFVTEEKQSLFLTNSQGVSQSLNMAKKSELSGFWTSFESLTIVKKSHSPIKAKQKFIGRYCHFWSSDTSEFPPVAGVFNCREFHYTLQMLIFLILSVSVCKIGCKYTFTCSIFFCYAL